MNVKDFQATLVQTEPPAGLTPVLQALWHDAAGNWEQAHNIAQSKEGTIAYDRLHAYLHRKEGDEANARYWYRRAAANVFTGSLEDEWAYLVGENLTSNS